MSQIYKNSSAGGGGTPIETIDGDIGSISGSTVTIYANNADNNSGSSVEFVNSGSISTLNLTDANLNTALGNLAGNVSLSGVANTLLGYRAGTFLTTGSSNVFVGTYAGQNTLISIGNVGIGINSLSGFVGTVSGGNTAVGENTLTNLNLGSDNTALGSDAGESYTGSETENIVIGNIGVRGESNVMRLGTQFTTQNGGIILTYVAGVLNSLSGRVRKTTIPGSYPYTTLLTDDTILVNSSGGAHTINLISSPVTGTQFTIKDASGNAAANNITITPASGNIDGSATYVINNNYGALTVIYSGTKWNII